MLSVRGSREGGRRGKLASAVPLHCDPAEGKLSTLEEEWVKAASVSWWYYTVDAASFDLKAWKNGGQVMEDALTCEGMK
ncbi:hypothetical protein OPV22_034227 [Ensete ventricosum]|uniref:Uncharacterized protein n=1 Tax=Ensete ventricosum TaxID=4639 RepID=A0AAV8P435_ENSVE|nr:hypothetical protein OPV22_034227 [Ensete ventricosum]